MNGKKAKAIRRKAALMSVGEPRIEYVHEWVKKPLSRFLEREIVKERVLKLPKQFRRAANGCQVFLSMTCQKKIEKLLKRQCR